MPSGPGPESATAVRRSGWRVIIGVLWVLGALLCAVLSRLSLLAGHPAYPVTLAVVFVVGLLLVVSGRRRVPADRPRHRVTTVVGRLLAALVTMVVLGTIGYLVPMSASEVAVAAMAGTNAYTVADSPTRIVLTPTRPGQVGFVFLPGAKVDPRAYVPLLGQVAASGALVEIVKEPYDIAFLAVNEPATVIDRNPQVSRWAVGGHSLGGVAASLYAARADPRAPGLVFWASYPIGSLSGRGDLTVASIYGTADGLVTPASIDASHASLPASTVFTPVDGGVHAYFGDYGLQPGDGTPTVDRGEAQRQIAAATNALLSRLTGH